MIGAPEAVPKQGQGGLPPLQATAAHTGVLALADVPLDELAARLAEQASAHLPQASPRLRSVLAEYGVPAGAALPGAPQSLREAALEMGEGAFGASTAKVQRLAMARWHLISIAEAMAAGSFGPFAPPPSLMGPGEAETVATAVPPSLDTSTTGGGVALTETATSLALGGGVVARRSGRLPLSPAIGELPPRQSLTTAADIERLERHVAGAQLLAFLPDFMHHAVCGLDSEELARMPVQRTSVLFKRTLGSFSAGSLGGCRRALYRLVGWLRANDLADACILDAPPWLKVSGGMLALWIEDERMASRGGVQGGESVPASLKAGIVFGVAHAGLAGLKVAEGAFLASAAPSAKPPRQALASTPRVLAHFRELCGHPSEVVRYYAAGCVLTVVAALRLRDAQRASIELLDELVVGADGSSQLGFLRGRCYSSKHPKRRSPKPKLFGAPRRVGDADAYLDVLASVRERLEGGEWDYLFPRTSVPRGAALDDPRVAWLAGPAPSAEVIRRMRALLRNEVL